ncbi:hypothetical protein SporoP8_13905 [Sporosarcina ureae]|uniref:hypothetical protein n=1 Tax=Sporosarcina ureae TaxID=1571 RepID=UPI000A147488|nr:hypothetical protein [Sporosarcina ureae]ARJ39874.1 hypothetical protein SporoP8_13905 [Sporosarcina ureae]
MRKVKVVFLIDGEDYAVDALLLTPHIVLEMTDVIEIHRYDDEIKSDSVRASDSSSAMTLHLRDGASFDKQEIMNMADVVDMGRMSVVEFAELLLQRRL